MSRRVCRTWQATPLGRRGHAVTALDPSTPPLELRLIGALHAIALSRRRHPAGLTTVRLGNCLVSVELSSAIPSHPPLTATRFAEICAWWACCWQILCSKNTMDGGTGNQCHCCKVKSILLVINTNLSSLMFLFILQRCGENGGRKIVQC